MVLAAPVLRPQPAVATARDVLLRTLVGLNAIIHNRVPAGFAMSTSDSPAIMLLVDGQTIPVSMEMYEYLKLEAAQRGVSTAEIYREEMQAKAELKTITPRNEELLRLAERFPAPQEWYDE